MLNVYTLNLFTLWYVESLEIVMSAETELTMFISFGEVAVVFSVKLGKKNPLVI